MDRDGTLLALGTAAALAAAALLRRGGSPSRVFPFLSKRVPVRYNALSTILVATAGLAWSAPAALAPLLANVPPVTQNTFLRWARGMDRFDPQPVLVRAGDRFLGIFDVSATATPGWDTLIGQVLFEGVEHRGLLDLERVHPAGTVGAPGRLVLKLPDSVLAMPRISDTPRGSRGELVSLAQRRTRKDEPRFQVYTVVAEPDSDWMIEAGFADIEAARRHRDEILKAWGRKLKIVDRKALAFHGEDPREARHWMRGNPMPVVSGTPLLPLDAAKVAIHNAYWWTWGRPFAHLDEAVVDPAEHAAARQWAPKAAVVILREYGLPDDFAWWEGVDTELERIGARLYNESINPGVYALFPIPAPARPTLLRPNLPIRPRGSFGRLPQLSMKELWTGTASDFEPDALLPVSGAYWGEEDEPQIRAADLAAGKRPSMSEMLRRDNGWMLHHMASFDYWVERLRPYVGQESEIPDSFKVDLEARLPKWARHPLAPVWRGRKPTWVLRDGHHRLAAAKFLGLRSFPVRGLPPGSAAKTSPRRKVPPPLPASMGMRHTYTFAFRIPTSNDWIGRGPPDLARAVDTRGGWGWGTFFIPRPDEGTTPDEEAVGVWITSGWKVGQVSGTLLLATQIPLTPARAVKLARTQIWTLLRKGLGNPEVWNPPLDRSDIDVFPRIASPKIGSRAEPQEPLSEGCYVSGYCGEFAVALHRRYGWPLGAFFQVTGRGDDRDEILLHVVAYPPGRNKVADVVGIRPKAEVKALLLVQRHTRVVERKVTEKDLDDLGAEGLLPEVLADAEAFVTAHPERWR